MNTFNLLDTFQQIVIMDFLRYFIPASLAFVIFWVALKNRLAHRFIQKHYPRNKKIWHEFKYSMSTVIIFATIGVGMVIAENLGYLQLYETIDKFGWHYFFISLVIAILFHDFYFYWTHRWMHQPKIFNHVHKVHHRSTNPSPWAAYAFHPIEAIVQALVLPILLFTLPMHTLAVFVFLIYMILRNVLGHLGYELFPKGFSRNKWLNWHTTTTHHSMHHEFFNCNYGLYFSWWDNWMKTTHQDYDNNFEEVTNRIRPRRNLKMTVVIILLMASNFGFSQNDISKKIYTSSIKINQPVDSVWKVITDSSRWKYWDKSIIDVRFDGLTTKKGVGSMISSQGKIIDFRLVEIVPGSSYIFYHKLSSGRIFIKRSVAATSNGTLVTEEVKIKELSIKNINKYLGYNYEAEIELRLQTLKHYIEDLFQ